MQKNRSLVNKTITNMKQYIKEQKMKPGDKLPIEKELADIFKVGRSTLREAVKILSYADVLEVRQGAGTFIKQLPVSKHSDAQLVEVRTMLEAQAIEQVAKNHRTEDLVQLKELLFKRNTLLENGEFSLYIEVDLQFHEKIISLANNPLIEKWYHEIREDIKSLLSAKVLKADDYADNTRIHNIMYKAICDSKPEEARLAVIENSDTE